MKIKIDKVVGRVVQVGETITNAQPLIVDLRGVRERLTDAVAHDAVGAETEAPLSVIGSSTLNGVKPGERQPTMRVRAAAIGISSILALAGLAAAG